MRSSVGAGCPAVHQEYGVGCVLAAGHPDAHEAVLVEQGRLVALFWAQLSPVRGWR